MGEESVSVQVEYSNRSEDFKKDNAKGIENQSKVDCNAMILDRSYPKQSNLTESSGSREVGASSQSQEVTKSSEKGVGKPVKRKRVSLDDSVLSKDKETLVAECQRELDSLFEYYKELSAHKLNLEEGACTSNNSLVAGLLEESNLSYAKLVEAIYEKLKGKEGITLAIIRSAILSVGQRISYGNSNAEADLLEDESEACLWCWETKDMKLLPTSQRGDLYVRRAARKKIHERISALSATLSALAIPENQSNYKSDLKKASMKLGKIPKVEEIRSLVEKKKQKHDADMAEKVAKLKEKETIREIQKEKLQTVASLDSGFRSKLSSNSQVNPLHSLSHNPQEKEIKWKQDEAEKEVKRREKEEAESKRQLKKQQDEAERERRRREREEAELKEQRCVKKQATIMERFLMTKKSNNNSSHSMGKQSSVKAPTSDSPANVEVVNVTTSLMDNAFSMKDGLALEDLRKLHADGWHKLSRCNRSCHWGVRNKPKVELIKELKLHESSTKVNLFGKAENPIEEVASSKDFSRDLTVTKLVDDGSEKSFENDHTGTASNSGLTLRKKLLQFDKSNRPAYYGTWTKKSCVVGPRAPLKKDPDLDYDVDSDEEWEEEEPGESLSDCEKDADEERLEEENLKLEEEESEDDFFVPDGYLSEDEGVQVDGKSDRTGDETGSLSSGQSEVEGEEIKQLLQQQKYLQTLTEQALRKARPLVILNLMHEKSEIKMVGDITDACKIEQMCLQALSMRAWTGGCIIDLSGGHGPENEDQELPQSQNKSTATPQSQNKNTTPSPSPAAISDSDLPEFVSSIQSNSQGINRVLESLQGKFPTTPKSHLRNKVKEISEYVDNRWQVKKEILDMLGLSTSPGKDLKPKGIATFFSKRCLPPEQESMSASGTSPQQCSKTEVLPSDGTRCSNL